MIVPRHAWRVRALVLVLGIVAACGQSAAPSPLISARSTSLVSVSPSRPAPTNSATAAVPVVPKAVIDSGLEIGHDLAGFGSLLQIGKYVWLGSRQGLFRIDPATNAIEQIDDRRGPWIETDGSGILRIAYGDNVLRRYDAGSGKLEKSVEVPGPGGILVRDDRVWVTEQGKGGLRVYDSADLRLLERTQIAPPVGECCGPGTIRAADGLVWIADPQHKSVIELDAYTGDLVQTLNLDASPSDGLTVAGGALWTRPISLDDPPAPVPHDILRIDASSGAVDVVDLPAPVDDAGLVTEIDGQPWIGGSNSLLEIDSTGTLVREVTFDAGEPFTGSAYEAFGDVWLISEADARVIRLPRAPFAN